MKKRMLIMLVGVIVLFILVFGFKVGKGILIGRYMATHLSQVVTVSAMRADYSAWQSLLTVSGSLRAVQGVNITTEMAGMVKEIYFTPGALTQKGDLLVQLDISPDLAQLHLLEANAQLMQLTYTRDKAQYAAEAVSQATLEIDNANLKSAQAQVEQQKATIEEKTIRAPFSGRLGISKVNVGQYLSPGNTVTMLQTLDPIYVDFYIPQQLINQIKVGQKTSIMVEPFPNKLFIGKITTLDPGLDASVRNVQVEATVANPNSLLAPGMFATVNITTGDLQQYITLPQSAISFNPYGELIYIISQEGKDKDGKTVLKVHQRFIKTGDKRGDQVSVLSGIKKGDMVVTSGQLKLKNGSLVEINNNVQPTNNPNPQPIDE